jgi:hypothetical protein
MNESREIVYRYNGDPKSEEFEQDLHGVVRIPQKGTVIARKGKRWTVIHVNKEIKMTAVRTIPVYRVYLTDHA